MDIQAIEDNIEELENADTTVENVQELASLYIVKEHLKNSNLTAINENIRYEFEDILPQYREYLEVKKKYQLGELPEQAVKKSVNSLCKEIYEFIHTLYCCTDMKAERDCIDDLIIRLKKM